MTIAELSRKATANHPFGDERDAAAFFNMSPRRVRMLADVLPGCWRCGPAIRFDKRIAATYAAQKVFASLNSSR